MKDLKTKVLQIRVTEKEYEKLLELSSVISEDTGIEELAPSTFARGILFKELKKLRKQYKLEKGN